MRKHPLDAISADSFVAIKDLTCKRRHIVRSERSIDQQKIIAASAGLHEGNCAGQCHSRSTSPSEVALPSTVEALSKRRNSFCSRLRPSTSNCTRTCLPVLPC